MDGCLTGIQSWSQKHDTINGFPWYWYPNGKLIMLFSMAIHQIWTTLSYIMTHWLYQPSEITHPPALGTMRLIARKMLYVKCVGLCLRSFIPYLGHGGFPIWPPVVFLKVPNLVRTWHVDLSPLVRIIGMFWECIEHYNVFQNGTSILWECICHRGKVSPGRNTSWEEKEVLSHNHPGMLLW